MKVCYFGNYYSDFSRSHIYIDGLRQNQVEVVECQDHSSGWRLYWQLWKKHRKLNHHYDVMIVGYPGHFVVWLAKLISKKPVIFDALCTLYEGIIISKENVSKWSLLYWKILLIDWLSVQCADIVLVESQAQKKYFVDRFPFAKSKLRVVYTGAHNGDFFVDEGIKKHPRFTVLFRGRLLPEAGVKYILESADILKTEDIHFVIIGFGFLLKQIQRQKKALKLKNLDLLDKKITKKAMRDAMLACHVSLGQFDTNERLERTIPHKAFESLALKLPYLTGDTRPVREILTAGKSVMFVPLADPQALAEAILKLKQDMKLRDQLAKTGYQIYQEEFNPKALGGKLRLIIQQVI